LKLWDIFDWLQRIQADGQLKNQIDRVERYLQDNVEQASMEQRPVLFFNASTRIHRLSINAAFNLISSWGVRRVGIPVFYAVCQRGMEQCILGTNREAYTTPPPCKHCIPFSHRLFPSEMTLPLNLNMNLIEGLSDELQDQSMDQLISWKYKTLPIGELCIPSLRWALRRHHLFDDEPTRQLMSHYLRSAASLVEHFEKIMEDIQPRVLVIFNGITYPEAVAREVSRRHGIPVVSHEVGLRPYSAFFTYKDATFREVNLPPSGQLSESEEKQLELYLKERFKGKFTMAGIQFWPEMTSLPEHLNQRIEEHRQMVVIFTNVIFDTSQIHANTLFDDMFSWLNDLQGAICGHPDTLFVIRAHPDEDRPGKESQESVTDWFHRSQIKDLPNVIFFPPYATLSSYELIHRSKFVLVYNSSIGLEASIMGSAVLCGGRARYTQLPTTFFPKSREAYLKQLEEFLETDSLIVSSDYSMNARRFLHHELFHASLDLSEFLIPYPNQPGMTLLNSFDPSIIESSDALKVITQGILHGRPFIYPRNEAERL
jgi:hypothetical protein